MKYTQVFSKLYGFCIAIKLICVYQRQSVYKIDAKHLFYSLKKIFNELYYILLWPVMIHASLCIILVRKNEEVE